PAVNQTAIERLISASLLRIRGKAPFFAALSLFAKFRASDRIPTAATNGRDVLYNPEFLLHLPPPQLDAVLVHEVLHAALLHSLRGGTRDPVRWNLACFPPGTLTPSGVPIENAATMETEFEGELVEIISQAGVLRATPEHPIYVRHKRQKRPIRLARPEWVRA